MIMNLGGFFAYVFSFLSLAVNLMIVWGRPYPPGDAGNKKFTRNVLATVAVLVFVPLMALIIYVLDGDNEPRPPPPPYFFFLICYLWVPFALWCLYALCKLPDVAFTYSTESLRRCFMQCNFVRRAHHTHVARFLAGIMCLLPNQREVDNLKQLLRNVQNDRRNVAAFCLQFQDDAGIDNANFCVWMILFLPYGWHECLYYLLVCKSRPAMWQAVKTASISRLKVLCEQDIKKNFANQVKVEMDRMKHYHFMVRFYFHLFCRCRWISQ